MKFNFLVRSKIRAKMSEQCHPELRGYGLQYAWERAALACKCIQRLSAGLCRWRSGRTLRDASCCQMVKHVPLHQYSCRGCSSCGPSLKLETEKFSLSGEELIIHVRRTPCKKLPYLETSRSSRARCIQIYFVALFRSFATGIPSGVVRTHAK